MLERACWSGRARAGVLEWACWSRRAGADVLKRHVEAPCWSGMLKRRVRAPCWRGVLERAQEECWKVLLELVHTKL